MGRTALRVSSVRTACNEKLSPLEEFPGCFRLEDGRGDPVRGSSRRRLLPADYAAGVLLLEVGGERLEALCRSGQR
jgi:hypothetical protein